MSSVFRAIEFLMVLFIHVIQRSIYLFVLSVCLSVCIRKNMKNALFVLFFFFFDEDEDEDEDERASKVGVMSSCHG